MAFPHGERDAIARQNARRGMQARRAAARPGGEGAREAERRSAFEKGAAQRFRLDLAIKAPN